MKRVRESLPRREAMAESYQHPNALVESRSIGTGTRIWAFAHVLPDAAIGTDCNICDHVFIENDVVIGDRVTVKCGVQIWDGVTLEDDVFVGPNATFTNDKFPRSKQRPAEYARTLVRAGASIGANATILPGLTIGQNAMIGAGAVVTRNVPANAIAYGNPAQIAGYVRSSPIAFAGRDSADGELPQFRKVAGVRTYRMPVITDIRGSISVGEIGSNLPFTPKRYFVVFDVPSQEVRGEHAHKTCHQMLICIRGQVTVVVDDGVHREEIILDSPGIGVHIPPMVWGVQYRYSKEAVLLVLASEVYAAEDYIREYEEYARMVGSGKKDVKPQAA
jgi:acetyltransferase-like isoleucine patch superfamily enzyme/dTDP-4-dehydrorhamnose 3,5-epimerase-like enzyme